MKLKLPIIIVNFKAYKQSSGKNAVTLAKICQKVARSTKTNIAVAVQATDLAAVTKAVKIPVLAQHVDPVSYGAKTGKIPPETIKAKGAIGTLINHSEYQLDMKTIKETIKQCNTAKLQTVVCASTPSIAKKAARLKPTMVAIEPPALIGGNISVTEAKPSIVTNTTKHVKRPVLCGAGVHAYEDVVKALELGTQGILIASAVVKARTPERVLQELAAGLKK